MKNEIILLKLPRIALLWLAAISIDFLCGFINQFAGFDHWYSFVLTMYCFLIGIAAFGCAIFLTVNIINDI